MKTVKKESSRIASPLVSIGSFYLLKQVQKHGKTSQQETKQKYINAKTQKPTIHLLRIINLYLLRKKMG